MGRPKKIVEPIEVLDGQLSVLPEELPEKGCDKNEVIDQSITIPTLKVKLVNPYAKAPYRANPTDAGADLFATTEMVVPPKDCKFMDLGIQMEIPTGMAGFIFARSGIGSFQGIRPRNCVGVIDSKYRGNIGIMIENNGDNMYVVKTGDKIAQIVFIDVHTLPIEVVRELDMEGDRGGGFGHTGK